MASEEYTIDQEINAEMARDILFKHYYKSDEGQKREKEIKKQILEFKNALREFLKNPKPVEDNTKVELRFEWDIELETPWYIETLQKIREMGYNIVILYSDRNTFTGNVYIMTIEEFYDHDCINEEFKGYRITV